MFECIYRSQRFTDRLLLTVCLVGLMIAVATNPTLAQTAQNFRLLPDPQRSASIKQAYFVFEAAAGSQIDDAILVRNRDQEPVHLSLFAADAVTASRGGVAIATRRGDIPQHAGAWLHLSETDLSLEPKEELSVPFSIRVPEDLSPGEYAASIVAQRTEEVAGDGSGSLGVRFIPRFGVTVLVTVPGSVALQPELEILDLRAATGARQQAVIADLDNHGNDGLDRAEGHLTVRRTNGELLQDLPVRLGYFLAGDDLDYRVGLEEELAAGEYDVTLSLTYQLGTVELTRRLFLGELPDLPVVRAGAAEPSSEPSHLPQWVLAAITAALLGIFLLMVLLAIQSRRLARARSRA